MEEKTIEFKTGAGKCPVRFVDEVFGPSDAVTLAMLREVAGVENPRIVVVADGNVVQRTPKLGVRMGKYIHDNGIVLAAPPVLLNCGEKVKVHPSAAVDTVVSTLESAALGANDVLVAIGGGSLFDAASFAAAVFAPGCKVVRIPTTVAAFVDGAFAVEARLDTKNRKDALRVPSWASGVIVDFTFLQTILEGVWKGGFGEVIRHAASCDASLMKKIAKSAKSIRDRSSGAGEEILRLAIASRAKTGGSDFALWCANRLEAISGYKLPHGYAVPISICIECAYAVRKNLLKPDDQEMICRALADSGALDGLDHNIHLIADPAQVLEGLDEWKRLNGAEVRTLLAAPGKRTIDETADREAYTEVFEELSQVAEETKEEA